MDLDEDETRYFRTLVAVDQGGTQAVRREALDQAQTEQRLREARRVEAAAIAILGDWVACATHELARVPGFRADPGWIAQRLRPRVDHDRIARGLDALRQAGWLIEGPDGIEVRDAALSTDPEVAQAAVQPYHRETLTLAAASVTDVDASQRHLVAFTVAVAASDVPALKSEVQRLAGALFGRCQGSVPEQVVQVNLSLIPLTGEEP